MSDGRGSFQPNCRNGKLGSIQNGKFMALLRTNPMHKDGFVENSISESHLHKISIPAICLVNITFDITLKGIFKHYESLGFLAVVEF